METSSFFTDQASSMFYTHSTIAQVLAAFLALSGVFMIFKLQEIRTVIIQIGEDFLNQIKGIPELKGPDKTILYPEANEDSRLKLDAVNYELNIIIPLARYHRLHNLKGICMEMKKVHLQIKNDYPSPYKYVSHISRYALCLMRMRKWIILFSMFSMVVGIFTILHSIFVINQVNCLLYLKDYIFNWSICLSMVCMLTMLVAIVLSIIEPRV